MAGLHASDLSYYIDFQYDAERLLNWYYDNVELQQPWPDRGYNILKYGRVKFDDIFYADNTPAGHTVKSNYPLDVLQQFSKKYNFDEETVGCQFVQIPAGHQMPLHTDDNSRKFAVLFPLTGGTPTVFCNRVGRVIAQVEHKENVPVLVRADIPHTTTALPEFDKINYQISFRTIGGKNHSHANYWYIRDKLKNIDENKLC